MPINLQSSLTQLAMWPTQGTKTGLRAIDRRTKNQHPQEVRALERAAELGASHVYFRYFPDRTQPPKAEIFVFDRTDQLPDKPPLADSVRCLWNSGAAPLAFVFHADGVDVINAMQEPKLEADSLAPKYQPAETISIANELAGELEEEKRRRFSALAFDNGSFWENPDNSPFLTNTKTALQSMLRSMRELRNRAENAGFEKPVVNRLLILCLMIKFLEDRNAFSGHNFFSQFSKGATQLFDVLKKPQAFLRCLASLEERFNGDVFSLTPGMKSAIRNSDLVAFAEFVEGKTDKKQAHFWKLYSFEHLPVEIISYLYEDFIEPLDEDGKPEKTSVYTPHHLVELILDEAMPHKILRKANGDFKVIDPACGSGVFLVGAFRRLVDTWRSENAWKLPPASVLKKLLRRNIHGIDLDPQAVELTTFSLCLAVCGHMNPSRIWSTLRFDPLQGKNIHHEDFFQVIKEETHDGQFDLVLGNPPFKSSVKTGVPKEIETTNRGDFPELPDHQICYLFLREAPRLLKKNALGYLILNYGFLYNLGTEKFRSHFFETYHVPHILDFVSIRGMFTGQGRKESADVKVVTVGFQNRDPDFNQPLLHATFRKTARVRNRQGFELDAYDLHWIPRKLACDDPVVWKANLLGGGRLLEMFKKYSHIPTLGDYLKKMKREYGWTYGEGVIAGTKTKDAAHLSGKPYIPPEAIGIDCIDHGQAKSFEVKKLECPRDRKLFEGLQLLVREHEEVGFGMTDQAYVFDQQVFGISTNTDRAGLSKLYKCLSTNAESLRFFTRFGPRYLVAKQSALQPNELKMMPVGINLEAVTLTRKERHLANELETYQIPYIKYGFNPGKVDLAISANPTNLKSYITSYTAELNPIYRQLHALHPIELENAFCIPFCFGKKPNRSLGDLEKIPEKIDNLLINDGRAHLRVQRVVRLFYGNVLFFIKPKPLRFWLRSIALRDADDTFAEFLEHDAQTSPRK